MGDELTDLILSVRRTLINSIKTLSTREIDSVLEDYIIKSQEVIKRNENQLVITNTNINNQGGYGNADQKLGLQMALGLNIIQLMFNGYQYFKSQSNGEIMDQQQDRIKELEAENKNIREQLKLEQSRGNTLEGFILNSHTNIYNSFKKSYMEYMDNPDLGIDEMNLQFNQGTYLVTAWVSLIAIVLMLIMRRKVRPQAAEEVEDDNQPQLPPNRNNKYIHNSINLPIIPPTSEPLLITDKKRQKMTDEIGEPLPAAEFIDLEKPKPKPKRTSSAKPQKRKGKGFMDQTGASEKVNEMLNKYGNLPITGLMIARKNIQSTVNAIFNNILPYDQLYHLLTLIKVKQGSIVKLLTVEKGPLVAISEANSIPSNIEMLEIPGPFNMTLRQMFDQMKVAFAGHLWRYDAFQNNCQIFVMMILAVLNKISPEAKAFVLQDKIQNFSNPTVEKFVRSVTNAYGQATNALFGGYLHPDLEAEYKSEARALEDLEMKELKRKQK